MKKRRLIVRILIIIVGVLFIALSTAYFLRNIIIGSALETYLSKTFETEVQLQGFDLQLFSKALDIDSVSILKKDDKSVYLIKTGNIEVALGPLLPMIFDKDISIYKIHFNKVHFLVPVNGTKSNNATSSEQDRADIFALLNSIDSTALLTEYADTLQSIDLAHSLLLDIQQYETAVTTQLKKIDRISSIARQEIEAESSLSLNSLEAANASLQQAQRRYATIQKAYDESKEIKNAVLSYKDTLKHNIEDIEHRVNKDIAYITEDIAQPKRLATKLSISLLTQMLNAPVTKYHTILSALLEFLQTIPSKNNPHTTATPLSVPIKQFLTMLTASLSPRIPSSSNTAYTDISVPSVPSVQSIPSVSPSTVTVQNTASPIQQAQTVPKVPTIDTSNTNTEHTSSSLTAQHNNDTQRKEQQQKETARNKMSITIHDFLLSVGIQEHPLFTLIASKISISDTIYTSPNPIPFYITNRDRVELEDISISSVQAGEFIGEGALSLNPSLPMLVATIAVGATPITIDTGLEHIQVKKLESVLSYQLELTMHNTNNAKATLLLANRNMQAYPMTKSDTGIVAQTINETSALDIKSTIDIKESKAPALTFNTDMLSAMMLPFVEKNIQAVTKEIQNQLQVTLYTQINSDIQEANTILSAQIEKANSSIQHSQEVQQLQQDVITSTEKIVRNYITQQASEEAARIPQQLEEEQKKIQKELEEKTENIIEDLSSSFGF